MRSHSAPSPDARAPRHPIAVVAERTGLSQDVLRIWERRYGAVHPERGPGGQRLYTDADIERLRLLHAATRAGGRRGIGQVAHLATHDVAALVDEDIAERERRAPPEIAASGARDVVGASLALARSLDAAALDETLRRAAALMGVAPFLESVAAPVLRRVGDEWLAGRLTPAHEHLVSSVLHDIAAEALRAFTPRNGAPRVLVTTPSGERHVMGAALVGAAAAVEGWSVLYLGADLPAVEIANAASDAGVRVVAVSVIYVDERDRVLGELRALETRLPANVKVLAGGAGARALARELSAAGVEVESSIPGFLAVLRRVGDGG